MPKKGRDQHHQYGRKVVGQTSFQTNNMFPNSFLKTYRYPTFKIDVTICHYHSCSRIGRMVEPRTTCVRKMVLPKQFFQFQFCNKILVKKSFGWLDHIGFIIDVLIFWCFHRRPRSERGPWIGLNLYGRSSKHTESTSLRGSTCQHVTTCSGLFLSHAALCVSYKHYKARAINVTWMSAQRNHAVSGNRNQVKHPENVSFELQHATPLDQAHSASLQGFLKLVSHLLIFLKATVVYMSSTAPVTLSGAHPAAFCDPRKTFRSSTKSC